MEKLLWKIYDSLIRKIFDKQITNEIGISCQECYYDMEQALKDKITYWRHIYPKKLMNQSSKILTDIEDLTLPF